MVLKQNHRNQEVRIMRKTVLAILISMMVFNLGVTTALADGMVFPQMMVSEYLGVRYHRAGVL
jgi:hypothetical protein